MKELCEKNKRKLKNCIQFFLQKFAETDIIASKSKENVSMGIHRIQII
jgi:hypothetical protein